MLAVIIKKFGGAEELILSEVPLPVPGPEQLLVKVHATGINRADILQRKGKYPPPKGESEILGLEIAGTVETCGTNVKEFSKGQRVFGLVAGGGYAQYCSIDKHLAMTVPAQWSFEQAAAVPEVFFTANETVFELGELKKDEAILIHAAGSGVGTAAIQMAKSIGAHVYVTAGSNEKINQAKKLGAMAGINYHETDFSEELLRLTENQGVDVVEDFLGAKFFEKNISVLKKGGRLILVACMTGSRCELDILQILQKRLQIKGFVMRQRSLQEKAQICKRFQGRWLTSLNSGKINPVIDSVYPLEQVREAHELLESRKNFGKVVLGVS